MKKIYGLTLLMLVLIIYACRKDSQDRVSSDSENSINFSVNQARRYVATLTDATYNTVKVQSVDPAVSNRGGYVFWNRARTSANKHYEVVEVPVVFNKKKINLYAFPSDSVGEKPDLSVVEASFSRLLIYRDNNNHQTIDKKIITYIPDKASLRLMRNDASGNWIDKFQSAFSGYIEYLNWDGSIQFLLRIKNGKRVARYAISQSAGGPSTPQIAVQSVQGGGIQTNAIVCNTISTPYGTIVCTTDGEGNLMDCVNNVEGYNTTTYCYDDGTNPPPNDPPQPPPPVTGGGGGGTTTPTWSSNLVLNIPPPGSKIPNITEYLKCFNSSQSAIVNIYVDQPTANSSTTWSGSIADPYVGHTFISIEQNGIVRVFGFYPNNGVNPITNPSTTSALVDDSGHAYDVKVTITVTATQLNNVLNYTKNYNSTYNLNTYNCTDFGLNVSSQAGVVLPDHNGSWPGGGGSNPGNLGQDIRAITSPGSNVAIKTTGGLSISNAGTCQ